MGAKKSEEEKNQRELKQPEITKDATVFETMFKTKTKLLAFARPHGHYLVLQKLHSIYSSPS